MKLKIGPFTWLFDYNAKINTLGSSDIQTLTIQVKDKMPEDLKKVTALHEILHAMFSSSGYNPKDEENVVDVLACQILQFSKENKEVIKKLLS